MRKLQPQKRVICAMSGGVDSSVAAALLKQGGVNIVGVFMKLWSESHFNKTAEKSAKKICSHLNIPFLVFDFSQEFKKKIVDYFLEEYQKDRTPNPCVKCNKDIKFGLFFQKAIKSKTDFVATGHYARTKKNKTYKLLKAGDKEKDQSYFLYNLKQTQLQKTLFPIGNHTKSEVKKMARKFGILSLVRPESQDICFIKEDYQKFFKKHLKLRPGPILDVSGKKIGTHQGLPLYTIGQRKKIRISGISPYYVVRLDLKKNALVVTNEEELLFKKELKAKKVNWISGKSPKLPLKIKAKIRYLHKEAGAEIISKNKKGIYKIEFLIPQRAVTSGQSIVFYKDQEVLGGGIII